MAWTPAKWLGLMVFPARFKLLQFFYFFTKNLNLSLAQASLSACLKLSSIVPIPKQKKNHPQQAWVKATCTDPCHHQVPRTVGPRPHQRLPPSNLRPPLVWLQSKQLDWGCHIDHPPQCAEPPGIQRHLHQGAHRLQLSSFNTIIPNILVSKLSNQWLIPLICS